MLNMMKNFDSRSPAKQLFIAGCVIFLLCIIPSRAEDDDGTIFNRLYREIMSTAPAALTGSMDSGHSASSGVSSTFSPSGDSLQAIPQADIIPDPSTEQLKRHIEEIEKDAANRHLDAVKFMQDNK